MARPKGEKVRTKSAFERARLAEGEYGRRLRSLAAQVGEVVRAMASDPSACAAALRRYSEAIRPWARAVASRMLQDVAQRDAAAWRKHAKLMGAELRREVLTAPTGLVMGPLLEAQVGLITSLPIEAARRVQELSVGTLYSGARASTVEEEILKTGDVTRSRATEIARTEVGRAASSLTEARARHAGSTHYVWRTAHDRDVRPLHKRLEGTVHSWDEPPISGSQGERSHPGCIYRCRCYPEPILPPVRR